MKINVGSGTVISNPRRVGYWTPILTSSTTFTATSITAPTVNTAGTVVNNSGANGVLIKYPTTATAANAAGVHSTAYTDTEYQMGPVFATRIVTSTTSIASQRIWCGLANAALSASASPLVNSAAIRYDTASDTTFKAYTCNGSTSTVTDTGVTVAAGTKYTFFIDMTDPTKILFYIDNNLVATNSTNLPTAASTLGPVMTITNITGTAKDMSVGTMRLESY